MASAVVELRPSCERILLKADNEQHLSLDALCRSVNSISLTETRAENVTVAQTVKDDADELTAEHQRDEGETGTVDKQLLELDRKLNTIQIAEVPVDRQTEEAGEAGIEVRRIDRESRTEAERAKARLLADGVDWNRNWSNTDEDGIGLLKLRRSIPQEHDENDNGAAEQISDKSHLSTGIIPRGPPGGIPVLPGYDQASLHYGFQPYDLQYGGLAEDYGNAPKFRKPLPEYTAQTTCVNPLSSVAFSPLMSGGNVSVFEKPEDFGRGVCFTLPEPTGNDASVDISGLLGFSMTSTPSRDFDGIVNDEEFATIHQVLDSNMPPDTFPVISSPAEAFAGFSPQIPSPGFTDSQYGDCVSPGFAWSPENPTYVAQSPTSTVDSGIDEELDNIMSFINEDLHKDHVRRASAHSDDGVRYSGNPEGGSSSIAVIPTTLQVLPPDSASSVATATEPHVPVTYFLVSNVTTEPVQTASRKFRDIRPRPRDFPLNTVCSTAASDTGMLTVSGMS